MLVSRCEFEVKFFQNNSIGTNIPAGIPCSDFFGNMIEARILQIGTFFIGSK